MTNATASRLGAVNANDSSYANENSLFLKVFSSGEVMESFERTAVTMDKCGQIAQEHQFP